jgi:UPF0755 protein
VGFYELKRRLPAKSALTVLLKPDNRIRSVVTVPEGLRTDQIVALLGRRTKFSARQYQRVLAKPGGLGLPSYAQGNPEGYLFPATYELSPDSTPRSILRSMVARYEAAVSDLGLTKKADKLGYSVHDVMTVASIVQAEGRLSSDFPKIARVIYNRLHAGMALGIDATVRYAFHVPGTQSLLESQLNSDNPYNTRKRVGLTPTPIANPGLASIQAAAHPVAGDWLYFVRKPDKVHHFFTASEREFINYKNAHGFG